MLQAQKMSINCPIHSPCIELSYVDQGSGEVVVLIHGLGENLASWVGQIKNLARNWRVIAMDLRGHGQSGYRLEEPLAMKAFADDVNSLLKNLGLDQAHFCGLSMGGLIALEIFFRYRPRVKSLVLADSAPFYPPPHLLEERLRLLDSMEMADWGRMVANLTLSPIASPALREEVARMFGANERAPYRQALIATFASDYRWILPLIDVPTLILTGEEDQVTPIGLAMYLNLHIRNSILKVVSKAAHISNMETPLEFNGHLREHLENYRRESE
jgi:3-oxoadipate enol-lactonase